MSTSLDSRHWDERVWSVATRSIPVIIQLVLGVLLIAMWLLGKRAFVPQDTIENLRVTLLVATAIAFGISLFAGGALVSRESSTLRGVGLSFAASGIVALIGGVGYAFSIY